MDKYDQVRILMESRFLDRYPNIAECCSKTGKEWDGCHLECCGEVCEGDHCENCGPDV